VDKGCERSTVGGGARVADQVKVEAIPTIPATLERKVRCDHCLRTGLLTDGSPDERHAIGGVGEAETTQRQAKNLSMWHKRDSRRRKVGLATSSEDRRIGIDDIGSTAFAQSVRKLTPGLTSTGSRAAGRVGSKVAATENGRIEGSVLRVLAQELVLVPVGPVVEERLAANRRKRICVHDEQTKARG
jgi:hypothetical protein